MFGRDFPSGRSQLESVLDWSNPWSNPWSCNLTPAWPYNCSLHISTWSVVAIWPLLRPRISGSICSIRVFHLLLAIPRRHNKSNTGIRFVAVSTGTPASTCADLDLVVSAAVPAHAPTIAVVQSSHQRRLVPVATVKIIFSSPFSVVRLCFRRYPGGNIYTLVVCRQ